jgi:hypothetical protein
MVMEEWIDLLQGCGEECPVEHEKSIHFVKHNVHDEYDDLTVRFLLGGWDGFWDGNFDWEEHVFALIQNLSLQLMQIVPFVRVIRFALITCLYLLSVKNAVLWGGNISGHCTILFHSTCTPLLFLCG